MLTSEQRRAADRAAMNAADGHGFRARVQTVYPHAILKIIRKPERRPYFIIISQHGLDGKTLCGYKKTAADAWRDAWYNLDWD